MYLSLCCVTVLGRSLDLNFCMHPFKKYFLSDLPSKYWWGVGDGLPGRDQSGLDCPLRPLQHLRVVLAAAVDVPQPDRPSQRGRGSHVSAQVHMHNALHRLIMCWFSLFWGRPEEYKKKVADYVRKYASEEALRNLRDPAEVSSSSESSMSDFSEDEAQVCTVLNICCRPVLNK